MTHTDTPARRAADDLWWERTLTRLNVAEQARLTALLDERDALVAARERSEAECDAARIACAELALVLDQQDRVLHRFAAERDALEAELETSEAKNKELLVGWGETMDRYQATYRAALALRDAWRGQRYTTLWAWQSTTDARYELGMAKMENARLVRELRAADAEAMQARAEDEAYG